MSELIAGLMIPPEVEAKLGEVTPLSPVEQLNRNPGLLQDERVDCPRCLNRGYFAVLRDDGTLATVPCPCMEIRRSYRLLDQSGLRDLAERSTFKAFSTPDEWTKLVKRKAVDYVRTGRGKWFYISGRPGSGKTHICTAICRELISKGCPTRYLLWREEVPRLKALVNEPEEYERAMNELERVPLLYIDDFFKGTVTDADRNLAFALLNARYNDSRRRTILSSELPLTTVRQIDPAISSRIKERAGTYVLDAPVDQTNWREKPCNGSP